MHTRLNFLPHPTDDTELGIAETSSERSLEIRKNSVLGNVSVRLARSLEEIQAAQHLRYQVFFSELGASADAPARTAQRDVEALDDVADHLIVVDDRRVNDNLGVVGTYRLLRGDVRPTNCAFYSGGEFNIDRLLRSKAKLLELGRSCVLREYRQSPVLQLLWKALALYVAKHRIEIMFGCASFHGTDPALIEQELAYLYHYHLARPALRPYAVGPEAVTCNRLAKNQIDPTRVLRCLPPLIRGYLQLGAKFGLDAYRDTSFNAIDVCVVLPTADLAIKYVRHYERECAVNLQPVTDDALEFQPGYGRRDD